MFFLLFLLVDGKIRTLIRTKNDGSERPKNIPGFYGSGPQHCFYIVEFRMHCKKGCESTEVTGTWQLAGYMNMTFFMRTGEAVGIPLKVGGRQLHLNITGLSELQIRLNGCTSNVTINSVPVRLKHG
jgi:hypothetical protein